MCDDEKKQQKRKPAHPVQAVATTSHIPSVQFFVFSTENEEPHNRKQNTWQSRVTNTYCIGGGAFRDFPISSPDFQKSP